MRYLQDVVLNFHLSPTSYIHSFVHFALFPIIYSFICPFCSLSHHLFIHLSILLSFPSSIHSFVHFSLFPIIYSFICPFCSLSHHLFIHLSILLSFPSSIHSFVHFALFPVIYSFICPFCSLPHHLFSVKDKIEKSERILESDVWDFFIDFALVSGGTHYVWCCCYCCVGDRE